MVVHLPLTDQEIKFGTDIMQEKCVWEIKVRGRRDKGRIMFTQHEKMDAPSLSKSWYPITLEPWERLKVRALKHSIDPNTWQPYTSLSLPVRLSSILETHSGTWILDSMGLIFPKQFFQSNVWKKKQRSKHIITYNDNFLLILSLSLSCWVLCPLESKMEGVVNKQCIS